MKLNEYIDIKQLGEYIDEGLISSRKHPAYPLRILNYTHAAQGVKNWTETLEKCRGLVYEENTLDVIAIPFRKFWNYNTLSHPETLPENLPEGKPSIYEKVDGSCGILFIYKNQFIIATRGSFESDQAKWAQKLVDERFKGFLSGVDKRFTYIFEIVYPQDRKVVTYQDSGLVLLGGIRTSTGQEVTPESLFGQFRGIKDIRMALKVDWPVSLTELEKLDIPNEEGYVAAWYGVQKTFRVKLKFSTYQRLHRMYFQTSSDVIWEILKNDTGKESKIHEYAAQVDDKPLQNWILEKALEISSQKLRIDNSARTEYKKAITFIDQHYEPNLSVSERRKEFARFGTNFEKPQLMFLLYDGDSEKYQEALWKIVRPKNEFFRKMEEDQ